MMKRQILIIIVGFAIMAASPIFSAAGEKIKQSKAPSFVLTDVNGEGIGTVISVAQGFGSRVSGVFVSELIVTTLLPLSDIPGVMGDPTRTVALPVVDGEFKEIGIVAFVVDGCPLLGGEVFINQDTGAPPDIFPAAVVVNPLGVIAGTTLLVATTLTQEFKTFESLIDPADSAFCNNDISIDAFGSPAAVAVDDLTDSFPTPYSLMFK